MNIKSIKLLREFIKHHINEAPQWRPKQKPAQTRKTQVADQPEPELDLSAYTSTSAGKEMTKAKQSAKMPKKVSTGTAASRADTARLAQAAMQQVHKLGGMLNVRAEDLPQDTLSDAERAELGAIDQQFNQMRFSTAEPEKQTALETIPDPGLTPPRAKKHGIKFNAKWHNVKSLPGYMLNWVRGITRPFYQHSLGAQLEQLDLATTIGGDTPISTMRDLINYIGRYGKLVSEFEMEIPQVWPRSVYFVDKVLVYRHEDGNLYMITRETFFENTENENYAYYVVRAQTPSDKMLGGEW